jgi:hypothetical protein
LEFLEQIGPFTVGEADIEEDEVESVLGEGFFGGGEGLDGQDVTTTLPEVGLEGVAEARLVLDQDYFLDGHKARIT